MENVINLPFLMGVLRRRWLLLASVFTIGSVLALAVAYVLPPIYESQARILVESQQIPSDLARSTITSNPQERIQLIEQRLLTRRNMLDIAERYDVFRAQSLSPSEIVDKMREAISFESIGVTDARRNTIVTGLTITFEADRAQLAAQVANELLTRVLEQNVQQRQAMASETVDFFDAEVERLSAELASIEEEISAFKRENEGSLPESLEFRRSELERLQEAAFDRESRRIVLEEQKRLIEETIEIGAAGLNAPLSRLSASEQELARLQSALAQQRGILADTHPAIRALSSRIASLESSLSAEPSANDVSDEAAAGDVAVAGRAAEALRQVESIERELDLLTSQQESEQARIAELRASIARTPQVEIALGGLLRAQETAQTRHRAAILKQAEAATGERLEVNRQAERFEILEQPQVADRPSSPNRPVIAAAGMLGSLFLGVGLMGLVEFFNQSLRAPADLEAKLDLRPVVVVPYISTQGEIARRRWTTRLLVFSILVIIPGALFLIDQFYLPLPILIARFLDSTGIGDALRVIEGRFGL